jgi:hypothetical protein
MCIIHITRLKILNEFSLSVVLVCHNEVWSKHGDDVEELNQEMFLL